MQYSDSTSLTPDKAELEKFKAAFSTPKISASMSAEITEQLKRLVYAIGTRKENIPEPQEYNFFVNEIITVYPALKIGQITQCFEMCWRGQLPGFDNNTFQYIESRYIHSMFKAYIKWCSPLAEKVLYSELPVGDTEVKKEVNFGGVIQPLYEKWLSGELNYRLMTKDCYDFLVIDGFIEPHNDYERFLNEAEEKLYNELIAEKNKQDGLSTDENAKIGKFRTLLSLDNEINLFKDKRKNVEITREAKLMAVAYFFNRKKEANVPALYVKEESGE